MTVDAAVPGSGVAAGERAGLDRFEGAYAGVVSRFVGYVIDAFAVGASYALVAATVEYVMSVMGLDLDLADKPVAMGAAFLVWAFVYFAYPLAVSGRTLGMAILGVRVVTSAGGDIGGWRAALRVLVLPLALVLAVVTVVLVLARKDRRALHDLIAGTAVVYAWKARAPRWMTRE